MKPLALFAACSALLLAIAVDSPAQRARADVAVALPPLVRSAGAELPIRLEHAEARVDTIGSMARTTVLLTLRNPNARVLEGQLEFALQPGQQVTGFALDIDGSLRDAVPVPKARGRQVFEDIERRNVDPALLEQTAGNQFRLRIYPIPAHGTRQVRLAIDETMRPGAGGWRLDLPVALLAEAPGFALQVGGGAAPRVEGGFSRIRFACASDTCATEVPRGAIAPSSPLALRFTARATAPQRYAGMLGDAHYVLAEVPVKTRGMARPMPRAVGLLWDASGSGRKRDHAGEFAVLDRYFRAMGDGRVQLRLLRDVGEDGGTFEVRGGDWSALRAVLASVVYDGATDLADWAPMRGVDEYLLVSDGLQDYGEHATPTLASGQRLYALSSSAADTVRLAALAEARGGRLVAWQGREGVDAASRVLLQDAARVVGMEGEGVADLVVQSRWIDDGLVRVAGRLRAPTGVIRFVVEDGAGRRRIELPVSALDPSRAQVPQTWAAWRVHALSAEPERNRAAIARLGGEFGLVTPGTSLLVLDDPADYVRYDIPAPVALRARVAELRAEVEGEKATSRNERLDDVADAFAERIGWWERSFPKGKPPVADARAKGAVAAPIAAADAYQRSPVAPPPAPAPAIEQAAGLLAPGAVREQASLDSVTVTGSDQGGADAVSGSRAVILLQPWEPDSAYARRLRDAPADRLYALYLDERDSHADSTAFYLDVADLLLQRGQRERALRVLSNLAELQLENRHVLRVLGYRLMQAREHALAVQVFRRVLDMAAEEPQSHRDLGLALAAAGEPQEAIRRLYDVVAGEWDGRFDEIGLVVLNELNQVVATSPKPLDTGFIDRRLLKNMPLDLRVALAWDSDNSDMDLWVTDPNGEKCYYGHTLTYQGGMISDDFTGGYGPEEFLLRHAKPGKYIVQAHYFGDRQQIVTGATSLSLTLSTGWGTPRQRDQLVTLRLSGKDESVLVGEFEVE